MSDHIHPRGCTCIPLAYGTMRVPMERGGGHVQHKIATKAIRNADCEVHGTSDPRVHVRYLERYLRRV